MSLVEIATALLVALLWGIQFVTSKIGVGAIPPLLFVALRFAAIAVLLVPFTGRPSRRKMAAAAVISVFFGSLAFGLFFTGLRLGTANLAAVLSQLMTPFTVLFAWPLLGERPSARVLVGIGVAFGGVALALADPGRGASVIAALLVTGAAAAQAFGTVLIKRLGPLAPMRLIAWLSLFAAPQLALASALIEHGQMAALRHAPPLAWLSLGYAVLFGAIAGFGLWFWLIARCSLARVAPFALLQTVFAIAASYRPGRAGHTAAGVRRLGLHGGRGAHPVPFEGAGQSSIIRQEASLMLGSSAVDSPSFFPGLRRLDTEAGGVRFAGVIGGQGPPVLLLHGYPQTHIAWRRIAPALAKRYTLVIPDLPGYGASRPYSMTPRWTKRRVGEALAALMGHLGHERFGLVGHDRGARVGYRLALDHPERVTAFASLTVVPTLDAMAAVDHRFATQNFHWFLFAQEADLPERLLAADPDTFLDRALARMTDGRDVIEPAALDAYRSAFREPAVRHAICEDYRAAMGEDLALDTADRGAGRKLACPVLVLWPEAQTIPGRPTPVEVWRRWADNVSGGTTSGGHLQPEDAPDTVLTSLCPFLARHTTADHSE